MIQNCRSTLQYIAQLWLQVKTMKVLIRWQFYFITDMDGISHYPENAYDVCYNVYCIREC